VAGTVKGLFYGDLSQFVAQAIGAMINFSFVLLAMYVFFKIWNKFKSMRVSVEVQVEGLDQPEVPVTAHPDFSIREILF